MDAPVRTRGRGGEGNWHHMSHSLAVKEIGQPEARTTSKELLRACLGQWTPVSEHQEVLPFLHLELNQLKRARA